MHYTEECCTLCEEFTGNPTSDPLYETGKTGDIEECYFFSFDEVVRCKLDPRSLKAPCFQPFNLRLRTLLST